MLAEFLPESMSTFSFECVAKKDKIHSNRCAVDNKYIDLLTLNVQLQILRLITFIKVINVGGVLLNNQ